jgi:hypothetical protein
MRSISHPGSNPQPNPAPFSPPPISNGGSTCALRSVHLAVSRSRAKHAPLKPTNCCTKGARRSSGTARTVSLSSDVTRSWKHSPVCSATGLPPGAGSKFADPLASAKRALPMRRSPTSHRSAQSLPPQAPRPRGAPSHCCAGCSKPFGGTFRASLNRPSTVMASSRS